MENKRLLSLDILRGMTMAGMILVNNQWNERFEMLEHVSWNGLTPCDLVFPFFLFIVGVSTYLSLSKSEFKATASNISHIIRRTFLLCLIGIGIHWMAGALWGDASFDNLRLWSVLQRIALSYCGVALFAVLCNHRYVIPTIISLLAVYGAILLLGNGYAEDSSINILGIVDNATVGSNHVYKWAPVDPEGLLGTISGIAHAMIGFYCGMLIKRGKSISEKIISLFLVGTVASFSGYLLSFGLPINKTVWSPSFALVTCGMAALLLAVLTYVIDVKGKTQWTKFFHVFGVNALICYIFAECLGVILGFLGITGWVFGIIEACIPYPKVASLAYAICFVLFIFSLAYPLYKKKIFIKL